MIPESEVEFGSYPKPWNRGLAFLDIETLGTNNRTHAIIEVACVVVGAGWSVEEWSSKLAVSKWDVERADPGAIAVNGFRVGEWADAPPARDGLLELAKRLHGNVIVGHNLEFDLGFLDVAWQGLVPYREVVRSTIDTYPLAKAALGRHGLTKFGLHACCEFLGIEPEGVHRALGGAIRCKALFERIVGAGGEPRRGHAVRGLQSVGSEF